jgi:hypothetical protein
MTKIILSGILATLLMLFSIIDLAMKTLNNTGYMLLNVSGLFLWSCCITLLWVVIYRHKKILDLRLQNHKGI